MSPARHARNSGGFHTSIDLSEEDQTRRILDEQKEHASR